LQVRNRGTIGGSVAHNDPAADFPVILTALAASFVSIAPGGSRTTAADDFFVDFYATALAPNEILTEVRIPLPPANSSNAYAKLPHPASGYAVVSAGALVVRGPSGECETSRIVLGGLGSRPGRATATEAALDGRPLTTDVIAAAASKAAEGTDPDGDTYATADYKRHMATVYARRAIEACARRSVAVR
jgi:carbon-monoxide dehydrogenase medium subunit